jgi:hypothetical protein
MPSKKHQKKPWEKSLIKLTKKSHKLTFEDDFRFILIGISSHENDYRVCWSLNNTLGTFLKRSENLTIYNSRLKQNQEFTMYQYADQETLNNYHLISNRCDDGFLLEEMSNIDYILKISGDAGKNFPAQLVHKLKKIDVITTAFEINPSILKSKKKLLF